MYHISHHIFSLHKYINNYIGKERDISINNINNVFEQITDIINTKIEKNNEEKEDIKTSIIEIKNEFDGISEETISHLDETKLQRDEIKEKIDIQMEEQFDKVNDILKKEIDLEEKGKNNIINVTQNYLGGPRDKNEKRKKRKVR